jgi:tRNA(Ile)-lysidine synthase
VSHGQRVVVALSGGVDSLSLLHALLLLGMGVERNQLSAFHVHHGLSPNADQWDEFCRDTCDRLDVPFKSQRVTVERTSKDGLEAAARRVRHAALSTVDADWVMLAHHRDDQAETLLFNLLRGTGVNGAAAMRECNGRLLRPLLSISRDDIECYAREHGLKWIDDETNEDRRFSRNYLRQEVIPHLRERFPATTQNLFNAAARFAEARDLLDDLACLDLGTEIADFPVELGILRTLDESRARNALRYLLGQHNVQIPSEARLRECLRQMLEAATDRHPAVVFGRHRLLRRRGWVYLEFVEPCCDKH